MALLVDVAESTLIAMKRNYSIIRILGHDDPNELELLIYSRVR